MKSIFLRPALILGTVIFCAVPALWNAYVSPATEGIRDATGSIASIEEMGSRNPIGGGEKDNLPGKAANAEGGASINDMQTGEQDDINAEATNIGPLPPTVSTVNTDGKGPTEYVPRPAGSAGDNSGGVSSNGSNGAEIAGNDQHGRPPSTLPPSTTPVPEPTPTMPGKTVVGYYAGWSSYKGYTPSKVPVRQLTHLNYAFAKIDPVSGRIALSDASNDKKNFAVLRQLKKDHPGLKTLISVGGWDYSTYFSDVASTTSSREAFAQSCVDFILEHGFDGVDLDWEYPVGGGPAGVINRPADKQNFTLLLKAVRRKLDARGRQDGRKYYLTIAGAAGSSYLSKIEPRAVAGTVDHIFVMTYDLHGPWDKYADLNAPLYQPEKTSPQYKNSVHDGIRAYLASGVPAGKIVMGMPFYGYVYEGVSGRENGLYGTFSAAKSVTYDFIRKSYMGSGYKKMWHEKAQVPYLFGNDTFISYDDSRSIAAKADLAKSMGLAGVGAWELSQDTSGELIRSAYRALY